MAKRAPPSHGFTVKFDRGMDEFVAWMATFQGELGKSAERSMKKATLMAMTEITDRIRDGKYKKLAPLTSAIKGLEGKSQTPLISSGALIRAITKDVVGPFKGVVGINKNARGKRGRDPATGKFTSAEIANIAVGLHEGMRIQITDEMRQAFMRRLKAASAKAGGASMLKKRGSKKGILRIPPRPYIRAVFEDAGFVRKVEDLFWNNLYEELGLGR